MKKQKIKYPYIEDILKDYSKESSGFLDSFVKGPGKNVENIEVTIIKGSSIGSSVDPVIFKSLTKYPIGYTPSHERPMCEDCIFMKWIGTGSKSQQMTYCTKLKDKFMVGIEDICDEFSKK